MLNKEEMKRALGPASVFEIGGINSFGQYFDGTSYLQMLTTTGVSVGNVVFEPGCRNHWHRHVHGARSFVHGRPGLLSGMGKTCTGIVTGRCRPNRGRKTLARGSSKQLVFPFGNRCAGRRFQTEWLEPVDPEEYNKLP